MSTNTNDNTMAPNSLDDAKAVLRWKCIAIQAYLKKQGKPQINNLTLHIKQLEKKKQAKINTNEA